MTTMNVTAILYNVPVQCTCTPPSMFNSHNILVFLGTRYITGVQRSSPSRDFELEWISKSKRLKCFFNSNKKFSKCCFW